jgi:hypothetical protein
MAAGVIASRVPSGHARRALQQNVLWNRAGQISAGTDENIWLHDHQLADVAPDAALG